MNVVLFLFLCLAVSYAVDFNQTCIQRTTSFYVDGVCYKFYSTDQSPAGVSTYCNQLGYKLATIRSADVVEGLIAVTNMYITIGGGQTGHFFVQAPNGVGSNYLNMNITNSTDNKVSVHVQFSTGNIPAVVWSGSNPNAVALTDEHSFSLSWPFCEIIPVYTQKGCGQSLYSNTSFVVQGLQQCADTCSSYVWCAGVNFNSQGNLCQILVDNLNTKNLTINCDWSYYERS